MDINPLISCIIGKCVFPFSVLSFHFADGFLCCSPICLFFSFVSLAWGGIAEKILLREMSKILLPRFSSRIFMAKHIDLDTCHKTCNAPITRALEPARTPHCDLLGMTRHSVLPCLDYLLAAFLDHLVLFTQKALSTFLPMSVELLYIFPCLVERSCPS